MATVKSVQGSREADTETALKAKFLQQAQKYLDVLKKTATTDEHKADQLRAYHGLGTLSRQLVPNHNGYGKGVLGDHAETLNRPYGYLSVARRFAERYAQADLDRLCKHPLGLSHLRALVDVGDKRHRTELQRRAYDEQLSVAALFDLKKEKIVPKRSGGAPVKVAENPQTAISNLLSEGDAWARRCEATVESLNGVTAANATADLKAASQVGVLRLKAIAKAVQDAQKALKRLCGT